MSLATLTGPPTPVGRHHAGDGDVGDDGDGDTKSYLHFVCHAWKIPSSE